MADLSILAGATSQSILVDLYILATGAPQTALVYNSSGLTAYYSFAGANATSTAITLATLATPTTAWSSGGFIKLDDTNMPGVYRLDVPNAVIAAAKGREVIITITGFSGMATRHIKIELTGWDNQDGVHGGLSALPNTAVTTNASLLTSGTGTDQLSVASGRIDAGKILGTAISTPATAGILDVNVKNMNNVAATAITTVKAVQGLTTADTIATYTGNTPQTGDAYARLGAPAGASVSADVAAVKSDTGSIKTATNTGVAPGASGGLFIAGTNAATAITTGLTAHIIGTVDTLTTYTGNTPQTGDSFARLGVAGVGLTNLGDTRIAHLDADISSRTKPADTQAAVTTVTNLTNAPTAGDFTATMKTSLNSATPAVTVSDKTGFSLSSAGVQAIWDALTSALTTVNSIGKLLVTNIDAAISSRSTLTQTQVTGGAYSVQSSSCVLGDARVANLDATISSRLASASYTAPDNTSITAIKAKTDNLPASPAAVGSAMTLTTGERTSVADALLDRDMATGTDSGGRTVRNALRFLRNKWSVAAGTLTVTAEDDTTTAWTSTLATDGTASPIISSDPA